MELIDKQLILLTLPAKLDFLPEAIALVRGVVRKLGLADKDAQHMELAVEEACTNVIEHAFEGEVGEYNIIILRRPGQIVAAVEDRGLPFDIKKYEESQESGLGTVLMKAFADEVHFLNLGRRGKRVELIKNLPDLDIDNFLQEAASEPKGVAVQEEDITFRLMRPEESVSLARCAYRVYGYTYSTDSFYFPERVRELVQSGLMISMVAVTANNAIIGHLSVSKPNQQSVIGESGQAIVDPRYRGKGLFRKIDDALNEHVQSMGLAGLYCEAITVHPYSQMAVITGGYHETGMLIGFTPGTMYFKSIQKEESQKRRPAVLFYKRLNEEQFRDVYIPPQHAGVINRIYHNLGLKRNINTAYKGNLPPLPEHSQVNIRIQVEASRAFLQVLEYGQDLEDLIKFRLKEICVKRIDCIYLDLPLFHPAAQRYCAALEMLGFFWGGIIPEILNGDVLRLQYINNANLELENVQLASDFSKELFQYVLKGSGLTLPVINKE